LEAYHEVWGVRKFCKEVFSDVVISSRWGRDFKTYMKREGEAIVI